MPHFEKLRSNRPFKVVVVVVSVPVADAEAVKDSVDEVDPARRSDANDCREEFRRAFHLLDDAR